MLTGEMPYIRSSLKAGLGVYGVCDPFINPATTQSPVTSYPNGAYNPPGQIYYLPPGSASGVAPGSLGTLQTSLGWGSGLIVKYVLYKSTGNPATVGGPAPVYYTDETLTTVSGVSTESVGGVNMVAGWLLPNTSTSAWGAGAGFTNTVLNNNGLGSYVFIGLCGFIPGAISVASTVAGDALIGAATNFTVARVAANTAPTNKVLGWALTAVSGGLSDVMAWITPF